MNATTTNQPHSKTITKATTKTIPPAFVLWSAGLLIVVICILLLCAVPPVSRDALTHHLYIPKLYIQHGAIYEIPEVDFSYFPMNVDLLYLLSLYLGNDIVPKFIHFIFALATSGLIFLYIKKHLTYTWACFGALFFLSTPIVVKLSTTAYVDLGLIFFSTLSLLFILRWADKPIKKKKSVMGRRFLWISTRDKIQRPPYLSHSLFVHSNTLPKRSNSSKAVQLESFRLLSVVYMHCPSSILTLGS